MRLDNIFVELKGSPAGLRDQFSLEERINRAEHAPQPNAHGITKKAMPFNIPGRQSHCWLCRRDFELTRSVRELREDGILQSVEY